MAVSGTIMVMNIIKDYIEYLKDNPEGYWFKRKLYGWGWTPATWQGWSITLLVIVAILVNALRFGNAELSDAVAVKQILIPTFVMVFFLIMVSYWKGEKPRWTWGRTELPKE